MADTSVLQAEDWGCRAPGMERRVRAGGTWSLGLMLGERGCVWMQGGLLAGSESLIRLEEAEILYCSRQRLEGLVFFLLGLFFAQLFSPAQGTTCTQKLLCSKGLRGILVSLWAVYSPAVPSATHMGTWQIPGSSVYWPR